MKENLSGTSTHCAVHGHREKNRAQEQKKGAMTWNLILQFTQNTWKGRKKLYAQQGMHAVENDNCPRFGSVSRQLQWTQRPGNC